MKLLDILISNRMISRTIKEKITSHKKAFSLDELFFSLIEQANYTIPG